MTNEQFANGRRTLHISQTRIARRAGISQSRITEFELGYRRLSAEKISALEAALRAEVAQMAKDAERILGPQTTTA